MRELVEAAVASAARSGVKAAVILIGEDTPAATGAVPPPPAGEAGAADAQMGQVVAQRDKALSDNQLLREQLAAMNGELVKAQQAMVAAQGVQAPAPADQPVAVAEYEDGGLELVALNDKAANLCRKKGIDTIGKLRSAFMAGELARWKLPRADIIAVAEQLLGKVPSGRGLAAPSAAAPGAVGAPAAGVPEGHEDRAWPERLKVARVKEQKGDRIKGVLTQQEAALRTALGIDCAEGYSHPNFVVAICAALAARTGDPAANAEAVKLASEFIAARGHRGVAYAQATSLIWGMGFDPKASDTVDGSLKAAGLAHLMESAPEPVGAA